MALQIEVELADGTTAHWTKDFIAAGIDGESAELMEDELLDQLEQLLGKPDTLAV